MFEALLSAIALVFVIEGLLPFVFPRVWRSTMAELIQLDDKKLRWMGLISISIGMIYYLFLRKKTVMQQNIWFTPDGLEDLLPDEAKKLEYYRRQLLDGFELSGYDLVLPPIAEFTDSLLTGKGRHLAVDTCRFTDQESGKMMGVLPI